MSERAIPVHITTPVSDPTCLLDTHRLSRAAKRIMIPQDDTNRKHELQIRDYVNKNRRGDNLALRNKRRVTQGKNTNKKLKNK